MAEKITFWRWVVKPRQLLAGALGIGGGFGVVKIAELTSPVGPSFDWFATGAIASAWVFFCLFEIVRDPEEYV